MDCYHQFDIGTNSSVVNYITFKQPHDSAVDNYGEQFMSLYVEPEDDPTVVSLSLTDEVLKTETGISTSVRILLNQLDQYVAKTSDGTLEIPFSDVFQISSETLNKMEITLSEGSTATYKVVVKTLI